MCTEPWGVKDGVCDMQRMFGFTSEVKVSVSRDFLAFFNSMNGTHLDP